MAKKSSKKDNPTEEETAHIEPVEDKEGESKVEEDSKVDYADLHKSAVSKFPKSKLKVFAIFGVLALVLIGAIFLIKSIWRPIEPVLPEEEVVLQFDPEGPYAILEPRRDGNAIVLQIKRVGGYEKIAYELAYQADNPNFVVPVAKGKKVVVQSEDGGSEQEKIDRGVTGDIRGATIDQERKSEYTQEILFGTCSKGDTFSTLHCVFDKGVENGTLGLRMTKMPQKGDITKKTYLFSTTWHMQKPDVALGVITSGDGHFTYTTKASRQDLANVAYTVVNDLSGAPKLDNGKNFVGKVYAFSLPTAKVFPVGNVAIEMESTPSASMKIARFDNNKWEFLDTKLTGSTVEASASGAGIFGVVQ